MLRRIVAVLILLPACSHASQSSSVSATLAPAAPAAVETAAPQMMVATAPAAAPSAPPAVDVRPIGMHIGGGPNDDATKEPFLKSIAAHDAELVACWAKMSKPQKVEFGIDALVPGKGGRAKVDRPRSTVKDDAFVACMQAVCANIEFFPPKSGILTKVSASVRMSLRG